MWSRGWRGGEEKRGGGGEERGGGGGGGGEGKKGEGGKNSWIRGENSSQADIHKTLHQSCPRLSFAT